MRSNRWQSVSLIYPDHCWRPSAPATWRSNGWLNFREQVEGSVGERVAGTPLDPKDVRARVSDLPGKAQQVAADLQGRAQKAAADLPGKAQKLATDLPGKAQKAAADLPGRAQQAAADLPGKAQQVAADLPSRAQKVAADVAGNIEQFAAEAPGKAQDLIVQLPGRLADFQAAVKSLSPDAINETIEAYTQLVGMIYGSLADRGEKTWSKARAAGMHSAGVVDAVTAKTRPAKSAAGAGRPQSPPRRQPRLPRPAAAEAAHTTAEAVTTTGEPTEKKASAAKSAAKPAKVTEPTPVDPQVGSEGGAGRVRSSGASAGCATGCAREDRRGLTQTSVSWSRIVKVGSSHRGLPAFRFRCRDAHVFWTA